VKNFLGTSLNPVKAHLRIALCAYLSGAVVSEMPSEDWSFVQRMLRVLQLNSAKTGKKTASAPPETPEGRSVVFIWETSNFLFGKEIKGLRRGVHRYAAQFRRMAELTASGCPKGEGQRCPSHKQTCGLTPPQRKRAVSG
jgi:hypothetical protein